MKRLAIFLPLALAACLPAPYGPYYRPSYNDPSAVLSQSACGGQAGPPGVLRFRGPEGLGFRVSAGREQAGEGQAMWRARVSLDVPVGTRIAFLRDALEVSEERAGSGRPVRADLDVLSHGQVDLAAPVDFTRSGPTAAGAVRARASAVGENPPAKLSFGFEPLPGFAPRNLVVEFPAITAGERSLHFPPVAMRGEESRPGSRTYRSEAHRAQVQARHARCLAERPGANCGYILSADPGGFSAEAAGFRWGGRVWVWDARSPFNAQIELATGATGPWRIASPVLKLRDADSGAVREQAFTRAQLFWHYRVPLDTPVQAPAGMQTTLAIDTDLGREAGARYLIRFPPFEVNGRRHELKPIELELRRFDGGIEPFNC